MSTAMMNPAVLNGSFPSNAARPQGRPARPVAPPRLRITRRGRGVLTFLAAVPLVVAAFAFALNGGGAVAGLEGAGKPLEVVTVQPGQSLWQLAQDVAPGSDPRDVIHEIMTLNALGSPEVFAGQQLDIPARYSR